MAMPGIGVTRLVMMVTVFLALLLLGFGPPLFAGNGAPEGTLPGISQMHANAGPALAAQWSPRKSPNTPPDNRTYKKPGYPQRGYLDLMKFLAGGFLGGLLCSLLFGFPLSLYWSQGNWPVGFLDLVAITTAAYLGYRLLRPVHSKVEAMSIPGFGLPGSLGPAVFTIKNEAGFGLAKFSHENPDFDLTAFVEYARQLIFALHDAWNHEDLEKVKDRLTPQMLEFLGMGLKILRLRGEISRVEDLSLTQIVVLMARQEEGRDIIVLGFQGQVVDYLLDRRSFKLVSGSMSYPERLKECWIFEREWGSHSWLLRDIQDSRFFVEHEAA